MHWLAHCIERPAPERGQSERLPDHCSRGAASTQAQARERESAEERDSAFGATECCPSPLQVMAHRVDSTGRTPPELFHAASSSLR